MKMLPPILFALVYNFSCSFEIKGKEQDEEVKSSCKKKGTKKGKEERVYGYKLLLLKDTKFYVNSIGISP